MPGSMAAVLMSGLTLVAILPAAAQIPALPTRFDVLVPIDELQSVPTTATTTPRGAVIRTTPGAATPPVTVQSGEVAITISGATALAALTAACGVAPGGYPMQTLMLLNPGGGPTRLLSGAVILASAALPPGTRLVSLTAGTTCQDNGIAYQRLSGVAE